QQLPDLNFSHPAMQEVLLQAAVEAGAEARRGVHVREVTPGVAPTVTLEQEGRVEELQARLVVCADGRASMARKWGNFSVHRDRQGMMLTGVLLAEMPGPDPETNHLIFNPSVGRSVFLGPLGEGRVRAYVIYPTDHHLRFHGEQALPSLIEESLK